MQFAKKLIGDEDERAVSPVIGVILMVAITVILAAVIAAFVLDLGQTSANPQAGYTVNEDASAGTSSEVGYTIKITSIERLDSMEFSCDNTAAGGTGPTSVSVSPSVGAEDTIVCDQTDSYTIIGEYEGSEAVLN